MSGPLHATVRVLLIADSTAATVELSDVLASADRYETAVTRVDDVDEARSRISNGRVDCVVAVHDPPALDGVAAMSDLRTEFPRLPVLVATEDSEAAEVIEQGPTDVLQLSEGEVDPDIVTNRIRRVVSDARQRGKYEQVFAQATDGIAIHDPETGEILEANRRLYDLLGYDPEEHGDLTMEDVVLGADGYTEANARDRIRAAAADGTETFEWLDRTADGDPVWVEVSLEPATLGGSPRVLSFVRDITERKENERLLRDREQQLAAAFDHPSSFAAVLDHNGRVVRVNEPALEWLDAEPEDVEGVRFWETGWWGDGESRNRVREAVERATDGTETRAEVETAGGPERRTLDCRFEPVPEGDGDSVQSVVALGYDITERKARESELRENRDALERLHEITSHPEKSFETQVADLLAFGARQLEMDVAFLSRVDEEEDTFRVLHAFGDHDLIQEGVESPLSETYCRRTVGRDADGPLTIEDPGERMDGDPAYEKYGLDCYLGTELVVDGEVFGTLCFAHTGPHDSSVPDQSLTLLELMAQWLEQELKQREYESEVEAARDRLARTFERVDDAFFAVTEDWHITYVNEAGADVLRQAMDADYGDEDLVGRHLWEEIPQAVDTTFYEEYHRALETQESVRFEEEYEPLDVWFEVRAYPDEDGLSVYFTDITERKEYERTLGDLLSVTRSFIEAGDEAELVDEIVEGASDVFGYDITGIRRHDQETGTLRLVRTSEAAADRVDDAPTYGDDEGAPGAAFQGGEPTVVDDLGAATAAGSGYGPVESAMFLPLGDFGVLSVGSEEPCAFDDEDVALVELLALAASSAFDRLDREAEMRDLQTIVEHVDEKVFLLDAEARFTFVTGPLASYLGREPEALTGTEVTEIVAGPDVETCEATLERVLGPGEAAGTTMEVRIRTADGRDRPVELELSETEGQSEDAAIAGVVTDISELAATRDTLASERKRFRELFENLPDPVAELEFVDGEPVVQYVNPAFTEVFGYGPDDVRGENLNEFVVPDGERALASELDAQAMRGEGTSAEVQRTTADGRRDFLLHEIPYARSDASHGFAVYTDITEQKERERYLKVLNRVLRHNLRNDMNVVLSLARKLSEDVEREELSRYAEMLQRNAREVADLSEKAKEIERIVGRQGTATRPLDVADRLREVLAAQREATPEVTIAADLPEELWVRATDDVRTACAELVTNAVEHNTAASPRLAVEAREDGARDGWVELRFSDNGPGIPDEEWEIIRGEEDISQLTHGSGLGLWLTRWIVESVGGEIHREETGTGTTVVLELRRPDPATDGSVVTR